MSWLLGLKMSRLCLSDTSCSLSDAKRGTGENLSVARINLATTGPALTLCRLLQQRLRFSGWGMCTDWGVMDCLTCLVPATGMSGYCLKALTSASYFCLCRLFEVLSKLQSHGVALPGAHGPRYYTLRYGGEVPQDGSCLFQALALAMGGLQSGSEVHAGQAACMPSLPCQCGHVLGTVHRHLAPLTECM